jgi:hypothetical protein
MLRQNQSEYGNQQQQQQQQQHPPPLVPHSTAYVASPAILPLPPNPYGTPVYSVKTP